VWFLDPKRRVRKAAERIIEGFQQGSLVPDPPLALDAGESLPQSFTLLPTADLAQGSYQSYIAAPAETLPVPRLKRTNRGGYRNGRDVVVANGPNQETVWQALVQ
jgi:hypothetical protein